jgi:hypothetical protein
VRLKAGSYSVPVAGSPWEGDRAPGAAESCNLICR